MKILSVEDMLNGKSNKYALAIAVAKRAREITDEAVLHGDILEEKTVNMAIEDFRNSRCIIKQPD